MQNNMKITKISDIILANYSYIRNQKKNYDLHYKNMNIYVFETLNRSKKNY